MNRSASATMSLDRKLVRDNSAEDATDYRPHHRYEGVLPVRRALAGYWEISMAKYAAAIDQGTTSTRFMVFDHSGKVVSVDQKEHEQIFPKPGWVEHDALEIWQ